VKQRRLHWYSEGLEDGSKPAGGILFLPGRGGHGIQMVRKYQDVFVYPNIALMALSPMPAEYGWYPMPNGPEDQRHSVEGLKHAVDALETVLNQVEEMYGLTRDKIILAGFSAGAVVALSHHTTSKSPCAGVVSHGGAILEPNKLKKAQHKNPIVLNHAQDDFCFDWFERYLPMKEALTKKGYKVWLAERPKGNHVLMWQDVERCQTFFEKTLGVTLGIPEWSQEEIQIDTSKVETVNDPANWDEWVND
jgi:predicted esterase